MSQFAGLRLLVGASALAVCATAFPAASAEITVAVHRTAEAGRGEQVGTIRFADGAQGLTISPSLKGLPPGPHGFHVHENPSCEAKAGPDGKPVPGLGAGGHYDPDKSAKHEGPAGKGHLGDLPLLVVAADGGAGGTLVAPRLKVADLRGRALVIHAGGDNYSDQPAALGGGGGRIACAVF